MEYIGRFAPSPTGPLHAGSLVAGLASWLDARAHSGRWLVRIEDVDMPRCVPGADTVILSQLAICGLVPDQTPVWQSRRSGLYQAALSSLMQSGNAYPCGCARADITLALAAAGQTHARHAERVYPGTCRPERGGLRGRKERSIRLRVDEQDAGIVWTDRRLGQRQQDVARAVGDYVLRRADGLWAYQLAVVVDDAQQGVTHVVRGEDLADNTPRQIYLQRVLNLQTPAYLHTPVVLGGDGEKLSKSNSAEELQPGLWALKAALLFLGLSTDAGSVDELLASAVAQWRQLWGVDQKVNPVQPGAAGGLCL